MTPDDFPVMPCEAAGECERLGLPPVVWLRLLICRDGLASLLPYLDHMAGRIERCLSGEATPREEMDW